MNSESQHPPRRTWFTTLVGILAILFGGVASLFTLFVLLLAIGKPYANSADPLGIFVIFILPPGTLLAGFGLLLRQRWARWWMILLMTGVMLLGIKALLAVPAKAGHPHASMSGPAMEALDRARLVWGGLSVLTGAVVVAGLFSKRVRLEFRVSGVVGPMREDGEEPAALGIPSGPPSVPPGRDGSILPALAFLAVVGAACLWFAMRGWQSGEVRLPARGAGNHLVLLDENPLLFQTGIGLLVLAGLACTGGAAWLVFVRVRDQWSQPGKER